MFKLSTSATIAQNRCWWQVFYRFTKFKSIKICQICKNYKKQLMVLNDLVVEMKTKLIMLEKENEFLKELVKEKIK